MYQICTESKIGPKLQGEETKRSSLKKLIHKVLFITLGIIIYLSGTSRT